MQGRVFAKVRHRLFLQSARLPLPPSHPENDLKTYIEAAL